MTADMAFELRPHGIAVVSLYPGWCRLEAVLRAAEAGWLDILEQRDRSSLAG
jgi:NAD(P)-dependent dehydrogenase (short-subunit alcohol dehydrogenase family)